MDTAPEITESEITTPPDIWIDDHIDEDTGEFVPGYMLDMSRFRRQEFETRCHCGTAYTQVIEVHETLVEGPYPELYQRARELTHDTLRTRVAACLGCRLLEQARETQKRADELFAGRPFRSPALRPPAR